MYEKYIDNFYKDAVQMMQREKDIKHQLYEIKKLVLEKAKRGGRRIHVCFDKYYEIELLLREMGFDVDVVYNEKPFNPTNGVPTGWNYYVSWDNKSEEE